MRYTLLFISLTLCGCFQDQKQSTPTVASATTTSATEIIGTSSSVKQQFAWGANHIDWDRYLVDAVKSAQLKQDIKTPCKKLSVNDCAAQLISIISKYESSFNPMETYTESFADSSGKKVVSRGLLQISIESANQSAYKCNIKKAQDLHDVKSNLDCGAKIIAYQSNKSGTLMGEPKLGCAAYFSVCRKSSKSNAKILEYLKVM